MTFDPGYIIVGIVAAILGLLGVLVTTRGSDRSNARTEGVNALKGGVETYEGLYDRLTKERETDHAKMDALGTRITQMESDMRDIRRELNDTQVVLADSLDLNVAFIRWAKSGAEPPPPSAATYRLKQRLDKIINHE